MTMNMPPPYQQSPHYSHQPYKGSNSIQSTASLNYQYNRQNIEPTFSNQLPPSMIPQQQVNRNQSPVNVQGYSSQNVGMETTLSSSPSFGPGGYQNMPRENNLMRMPEGNQQNYGSPMRQPMYSQQYPQQNYQQRPQNHYNTQPYQQTPYQHYPQQQPYQQQPYQQQNYMPQQQQHYMPQQPYPQQPYPQQQSYVPIYAQLYQSLQQKVPRNLPEQSLNGNFSYQNANFNCDYSIEENMVHCVICNQTYKAIQKKNHLDKHIQKSRNVNIRSVDEQQLKRLQKYNSMNKRGIMIKPIVQPDEFNVQYNPNEFVLRKVTQYKDINAPFKNQIEIQTDDPHHQQVYERPQDLGYQQPIRSGHSGQSSPAGRSQQSMRRSESPNIMDNPRNTNTRFQSESIRQQEEIFLSDRFDHHDEGEALKSNHNSNEPSFRESERKSNTSQKLGYDQPSLNARNAQSLNKSADLGYLDDIHEENEDIYLSNNNKEEIPIQKIVNQVSRDSQF